MLNDVTSGLLLNNNFSSLQVDEEDLNYIPTNKKYPSPTGSDLMPTSVASTFSSSTSGALCQFRLLNKNMHSAARTIYRNV